MVKLDAIYVRGALQRIAHAKAKGGTNVDHIVLNAQLPEQELRSFEQRHRIRLPDDYRQFISQIGNGGAGPGCGLFPLGYMDDLGSALKPWNEGDGFVGVLAEPFPFTEPWNDTSGMPDSDSLEGAEEEYESQMDAFDNRYYSPTLMNGAFPICHEGCALRIWLVVSGPENNHLWHDRRTDYRGLSPVMLNDGSRATFSSWYAEWLEGCLLQV